MGLSSQSVSKWSFPEKEEAELQKNGFGEAERQGGEGQMLPTWPGALQAEMDQGGGRQVQEGARPQFGRLPKVSQAHWGGS